jgi:predicted acylesterase/phospholipase RssA
MTLYTLLSLFFGRAKIQQSAYSRFFQTVTSQTKIRRPKDKRLTDLPASDVVHVLCATELTSGQPFYMSREMVLSPLYGRGNSNVSLPQAVYASAAFPIGFPPLRLRTSVLDLSDGQDDERPPRLLLSDGGVFNNLGTEAFTADRPAQIFLPNPSLAIIPTVELQLVVNASSPPKKVALGRMPVLSSIATGTRIMSVMYENTLRPRVQRLMEDQAKDGGPIVIDIAESPMDLASRILSQRGTQDPVGERAGQLKEQLGRDRSDHDWKSFSDRAARTRTVLSAVGRVAAVRLVRLGYLDTAIACHAHLGSPGIGSVPDEKWFQDLVDDKLSDAQLGAHLEHKDSQTNRAIGGM